MKFNSHKILELIAFVKFIQDYEETKESLS